MTITALSKALHADRARPRWHEIMGSVGLPRTDVEVRVARPGRSRSCHRRDRRGPGARRRGDDRLLAQSASQRPQTLRGGWLHTGDMGAFDEEGFLTLKDRSKDLIISGGSNIYPREVEEVLLRHPACSRCR